MTTDVTASSDSPAPMDAAPLLDAVAVDLTLARTLPAQAYVSPEVFTWEQHKIFENGWVYAARSDQLQAVGDQMLVTVGSQDIVLARGSDGVLRGFYNTCPHRGHELLREGECRKGQAMLRCPYHSWSFELDGRLRAAPRFGEVPNFDPAANGLIAVGVEEWRGWVFVNCSGDAPPFGDWVGTMDALLGPWEPERLVLGARHEYLLAANWKTVVENFLECYHCPSIHPELCRVSPPDSGERESLPREGWWLGGPMTLIPEADTMSLTGESLGVRFPGLSADQARRIYYFALFPNVLISLHPDYVMVHRLEARSPGETFVECYWLFAPEAVARDGFDPSYASDFWDLTNRQDFDAVESVWRGLNSRGYRPGPFQYRERGVRAFMASMADAYLQGHLSAPQEHVLAGYAVPGQ